MRGKAQNANTQHEGGVCQFLPIRAKNRLP